MAVLVWILAVCAAIATSDASRIVGGEPTTIEQYPGIVQVESRTLFVWSQSCGANIITNRYLVSAAHCFSGLLFSIANRRIRAGTTNRGTGGTVVTLQRAVNHPSYGTNGYDGDISILELTSDFSYSNVIQPVHIVPQGFVFLAGLAVVQAGWGATSQGGSSSTDLRDVTTYTIDNNLCRERYLSLPVPETVTQNMICTGILDVGGTDACQGDYGGPLYLGRILIGIASWGHGCANETLPGVSTSLSSYTDWIIETAV